MTQGSPARNVSAFASPVLLVHGDADQNVGVSHSREMESELRNAGKDVRFIEFENVAHSINDSGKRVRMLTEIDAFLTRNLAP